MLPDQNKKWKFDIVIERFWILLVFLFFTHSSIIYLDINSNTLRVYIDIHPLYRLLRASSLGRINPDAHGKDPALICGGVG